MRRIALALFLAFATTGAAGEPHRLVVCADPNNLPFSNRAGQGFENKIIALVAKDLDRHVEYVWWAQRRGYVRSTLDEAKCDLWPGVAKGLGAVATTRPYYRSSYVFVTRAAAHQDHLTLDDPRLTRATLGVQMIGKDAMNSPPAHAIANRGIIDNVRGYIVYGDYGLPDPGAKIVNAVAIKEIDIALVWGPLAGYFAHRSPIPLKLESITPADDPRWPMAYEVSMGVRRSEPGLVETVNAILERETAAINAILMSYHVPLVSPLPDRGSILTTPFLLHGRPQNPFSAATRMNELSDKHAFLFVFLSEIGEGQ